MRKTLHLGHLTTIFVIIVSLLLSAQNLYANQGNTTTPGASVPQDNALEIGKIFESGESRGTFFTLANMARVLTEGVASPFLAVIGAQCAYSKRFSLASWIPERLAYASVHLGNVGSLINGFVKDHANEDVAAILSAPLVEEMIYRYILQEILLKRLPHQVLVRMGNQRMKEWAEGILTDDSIRLIRVLASSLVFAIGHYRESLSYFTGGGVPQLVGGAILGAEMELTGNVLNTILVHAIHNSIITYLTR